MVIKARINVQYLENVEVLPLWAVLRSEPAAVVFAPRAFVGASDPEIAAPQWCAQNAWRFVRFGRRVAWFET